MAHKFTAEDRAKAKAVKEFKKTLTEETQEQPIEVNQRITELEQLRNNRKLRALEENEMLAVQLENKRMRDELTGISNQNPQEKRSDLELFKQFTEVQNQLSSAAHKREDDMKKRIMDEIAETDMEPESTEDALLKMLMTKIGDGSISLMKPNIPPTQANISKPEELIGTPPPVKANNNIMENKTDKQIIDELPNYVKDAIKSGGLTMDNVKQSFQAQGIDLTGDDLLRIENIYKQVQATKKVSKPKKSIKSKK